MRLQGHDKLRQRLMELADKERFPQTCLFYGLDSIGKKKVAYEMMAHLFCRGDESQDSLFGDAKPSLEDDKNYQMLMEGTHPDFFLIRPTPPKSASKTEAGAVRVKPNWTIKTEQIQELKSKLVHFPLMADHQIVLIDDADRMTVTTANSLLKLLEEPRPNQIFIMVSHQLNRVLPTLRSRSAKFYFSPLSQTKVKDIVRQNLEQLEDAIFNEQAFEFYYRCFQGSIEPIIDAMQSGVDLNSFAMLTQAQKDFGCVSRVVKEVLDRNMDLPLFLQCLRRFHLDQVIQNQNMAVSDTEFFQKISQAEYQLSRHIQKDFILENLFLPH